MTFIDSHCHLNFEDFKEDGIDAVLKNARESGISHMVTIACKMDEVENLIYLTKDHPNIFVTAGVHPHESGPTFKETSEKKLYDDLLSWSRHDKIIAFGETGLDYYYNNSPPEQQEKSFSIHIDASLNCALPLSIHTRGAEKETIALLKSRKEIPTGVIHCFSESQWLADEALALGLYISLSGIVTFKKSEDLRNIVKNIPIDRLLLETDAPFLAPQPHRGKRNEPALMIHTAQVVADLKGVTLEELGNMTTKNFFNLFKKASIEKTWNQDILSQPHPVKRENTP
jgi:TatD DNase family protein